MFLKNKRDAAYRKAFVVPFIYRHASTGEMSVRMLALLAAQIALLAVSKSFSALAVIFSAALGSAAAEMIAVKGYSQRVHFSCPLGVIQGIIVGMLVPESYPPLSVFFVTLAAMLVVKHLFGGVSYAWCNPAVAAVAVLWLVGPGLFPASAVSFDILSVKNPSRLLIEGGIFPVLEFDTAVTDFLNHALFGPLGASLPEGYISMLWDTHSAIPAFRYNLATIVASVVLFGDDLMHTVIPACFLLVYLALVRLVSPLFCGGIPCQGDMLLALLTGGTLFCAVFVLGWIGTAPVSLAGKILYGTLGGVAAFFLAGCGMSPFGIPAAVLIANIVSPAIQEWEGGRDRKALAGTLAAAKGEK